MDYEDNRATAEPPRAEEINAPNVVNLGEARSAAARKLAERADKTREKAERAVEEARQRAEMERAVQESIGLFVAKRDIYFAEQTNCWWFRDALSGEWASHKRDALLHINTDLAERGWFVALQDHLRKAGRWKRKVTMSFRRDLPADVLNTLEARFCPETEGEAHSVFDIVVADLANSDAAAQAHIEKLVRAKWSNPANHTLPALCLHDPAGGSGKSLFVSGVLCTAFGGMVADNISMEDVTGKSSAHLAGKAVWFVNESVEDKVDDEALKRVLGSRTIWMEPKGTQKFEVENTAWMIVAGNSPMGSVRVSNSAVGRRYSVIKTGCALVARIAREFGLPDNEAARQWIASEGAKLLSDPVQVGRWLRVLGERQGDVQDVPAFHGRDYAKLVQAQRPFHELVFDAVFRAEGFEYIRKPLLYKLYVDLCRQYNNGYGLVRNRALYAHLQVWAEREGVALLERNAKWTTRTFGGDPRRTSADVIYAAGGAAHSGELRDNDCRYGVEVCGRWERSVEP